MHGAELVQSWTATVSNSNRNHGLTPCDNEPARPQPQKPHGTTNGTRVHTTPGAAQRHASTKARRQGAARTPTKKGGQRLTPSPLTTTRPLTPSPSTGTRVWYRSEYRTIHGHPKLSRGGKAAAGRDGQAKGCPWYFLSSLESRERQSHRPHLHSLWNGTNRTC